MSDLSEQTLRLREWHVAPDGKLVIDLTQAPREEDLPRLHDAVNAFVGSLAAPATGGEREALVVMLSEAVRFASWAAGEGICPVEGQPARAPEDFLMEYSDATGEEEWETMADRLPIILALAAGKAGDRGVLAGVEKALKHALAHNLKFKQTGKDPKSDGYAYAEVPDWALRQWLNRVEIAQRGIVIQGSAGQEVTTPADGALGRQALSVQDGPISSTKPTDTQTAGGEQT